MKKFITFFEYALLVAVLYGFAVLFEKLHAQEVEISPPAIEFQSEDFDIQPPKFQQILPDLNVTSESVFVVNIDTQDVVFAKNENQARSIASITKMMTSYVVLQQPQIDLNEVITISQEDVNLSHRAHRASKLRPGMHFTRERLLNLALMSSENTAAAALGRTTFAGGTEEFVEQMNEMATSLGMTSSNFVDPIGIGVDNMSTASDLVRLIAAASNEQVIRDFSTTKWEPIQLPIKNSRKPTEYHNTNALVGFNDWNILVQKTGFTNAAGHCVAMIATIQGQRYAIIVLNSPNNQSRAYDAIKVREWLEEGRTLTTEEAKPLSPYKFVQYRHGKPIKVAHHKHHKKKLTSPK